MDTFSCLLLLSGKGEAEAFASTEIIAVSETPAALPWRCGSGAGIDLLCHDTVHILSHPLHISDHHRAGLPWMWCIPLLHPAAALRSCRCSTGKPGAWLAFAGVGCSRVDTMDMASRMAGKEQQRGSDSDLGKHRPAAPVWCGTEFAGDGVSAAFLSDVTGMKSMLIMAARNSPVMHDPHVS